MSFCQTSPLLALFSKKWGRVVSNTAIRGWWAHLNVRMVRMAAYSMMVLKMVRMQVTMKLSIAFRLLEEEEGASALHGNRI